MVDIDAKIKLLTPRERERLALIMKSTAMLIEACIECAGPDDARIALCVAISTITGSQVPQMTQMRMAEVTLEFAVESLIARRNHEKQKAAH